jgi:hypothetical protein
MADFLSTNWGDIVGAVGFVVTVAGFVIAIYQATKARKAADAAEEASRETRQAITRLLAVADLQRAIALIERLKDLHRQKNWEVSLQHYQSLRAILADVVTRYPEPSPEQRAKLQEAIPQIRLIEDNVDEAHRNGAEPFDQDNFNRVLNSIQENLQEMASSTFPGARGASSDG